MLVGDPGAERGPPGREPHRLGRLTARPKGGGGAPQNGGLHRIRLDNREAEFFVPNSYRPDEAAPLLVLLHGAGGRPDQVVGLVQDLAEHLGFLVLAPKSRGATWDVIEGGFDVDVDFLDRALRRIFETFSVDADRLGVGGFSDGASYALSLGLQNGDFFTDVLAFSPGFAVSPSPRGRPRIFISHGDQDRVLPIERCGRPLARELDLAGYDVVYREFQGGHVVPPDLTDIAVRRFLGREDEGRA